MKIGLFFGSFNPMHIGHKVIASYILEFSDLQQVWFIVSPQNPLKKKQSLLDQHHRLTIIRKEVEDNPKLYVSDIESNLSQPSYTIDTLAHLKEKYPKNDFTLIIGADNLQNFHKWKNSNLILSICNILVFDRDRYKAKSLKSLGFKKYNKKGLEFIKFKKVNISSSQLRKI